MCAFLVDLPSFPPFRGLRFGVLSGVFRVALYLLLPQFLVKNLSPGLHIDQHDYLLPSLI